MSGRIVKLSDKIDLRDKAAVLRLVHHFTKEHDQPRHKQEYG